MRAMVADLFLKSPLLYLPLLALTIFVSVFLVAGVRAWKGGVRGASGEALLPLEEDVHE